MVWATIHHAHVTCYDLWKFLWKFLVPIKLYCVIYSLTLSRCWPQGNRIIRPPVCPSFSVPFDVNTWDRGDNASSEGNIIAHIEKGTTNQDIPEGNTAFKKWRGMMSSINRSPRSCCCYTGLHSGNASQTWSQLSIHESVHIKRTERCLLTAN